MFLHIYHTVKCICPGSGFVSLHRDPDSTFIIQIRIHKSVFRIRISFYVDEKDENEDKEEDEDEE